MQEGNFDLFKQAKNARFDQWFNLKKILHARNTLPPVVANGDIWWVSFGENIGVEINGKSKVFTRPAVILKKLSYNFYFVIPLTTKNKIGSWYLNFYQKEKEMWACLHQARGVDYHRLYSKLGKLNDNDFLKIKDGFYKLFK